MEAMGTVDVVIVETEMEAVVVLAVEVVKDEATRMRNALSRKWIRIMIPRSLTISLLRATVPRIREGQQVYRSNDLYAETVLDLYLDVVRGAVRGAHYLFFIFSAGST
jgi:hypothetical protein